MYFFMGPTAENSAQQYTEAIGRYPLPAYWNLGFHLCRWGYNNLDNMVAAYNRTVQAGIPIDVQWSDIDFMDRRLDFTYDTVNFAGLPEFVTELHENGEAILDNFCFINSYMFSNTGRRFVNIIDPGVPIGEPAGSYLPEENGDAMGVWVLNATGQVILGNC